LASSDESDFIHLASASPRRAELLTQLGLRFDVVPASINEAQTPGEAGEDYVCRIAAQKAQVAWTNLQPAIVPVLAADTAVIIDGMILGKPADQADAERMLSALSGREHEVLSAVTVLNGAAQSQRLSRTRVRFREIPQAECSNYWHSGEPVDKAGGYAIQGLGAIFIEHIRGSYSGVMGLPLFETAELLREFGYRVI
jgi:septum formation protein